MGGNSTSRPAHSVSPIAMRPGFTTPTTSPGNASGTVSRSRPKKRYTRDSRSSVSSRVFVTEHVLRQPARTDAHERHAIAVTRVHVRLNLEHEAGEVGIARLHAASTRSARGPGGGASVNSACRNGSTPKSFSALPKKTGVCLACR